jgi:4-amino-4-deoxy-L-arabinose transferase-like glycosyltransferase
MAARSPELEQDRFAVPAALWLIMALALALRVLGAWCANLVFDERAHWALAQTIDFHPQHLHLVSRTLDHPLLSIYLLKLGSLLLGTTDFGLRLPYVLAGVATLLPVYFLGVRAFSKTAGLWAAALLAVDQFHAGWSRVFLPEVLMLLLGALALLQFLRALKRGTAGSYALLGALLGLAYLAKEPAALLLPALWIYLLVTPGCRHVLRRPQWYLAQAVMLLVVAPDFLWNFSQWSDSYLARDAALAAGPLRLSLKPLSLYLGECFLWLIGPNVLDTDYLAGDLYVCHWPAGLLYLAAVAAAAMMWWKNSAVRLLVVVFLLIFAVFFVMPGGTTFDPFWWASLTLIPAVVCAGGVMAWGLDRLSRSGQEDRTFQRTAMAKVYVGRCAALLLLAYLAVHYIPLARHAGVAEPRATVQDFAADFISHGNAALAAGDLSEAESRFIYALNIGGPAADAYLGLARIARQRGQTAKARVFLRKCLQLDSRYPGAVEFGKRLQP